MLCAAACGSTWGVADLRRRGLLARMVGCSEHILCWDCTQRLVRWSIAKGVGYFKCPLCRCEVREVVRDGAEVADHQFSLVCMSWPVGRRLRTEVAGRLNDKLNRDLKRDQIPGQLRKRVPSSLPPA